MKFFFRLMCCAAVIACMAGIYIFSSQTSEISNNISQSVSEKIVEKAGSDINMTDTSEEFMKDFNGIVRKYAHFVMYFALGAVSAAFFLSVMPKFRAMPLICALFLCLLWAVADEFHQLYVPGRDGRVTDIVIDFSGSFLASLIVLAVRCVFSAIKKWMRK